MRNIMRSAMHDTIPVFILICFLQQQIIKIYWSYHFKRNPQEFIVKCIQLYLCIYHHQIMQQPNIINTLYNSKRTTITTILHPFIGLFSRTTWVSRYQKGKTSLDLNEARDDGVWDGSAISWTICKQSAPHSRHITTPTPQHLITHNSRKTNMQSNIQQHYQAVKLQVGADVNVCQPAA